MGVKSNVQGISIAPLKSALAYADDELGITVATSSYAEICTALANYFPLFDGTIYEDGNVIVPITWGSGVTVGSVGFNFPNNMADVYIWVTDTLDLSEWKAIKYMCNGNTYTHTIPTGQTLRYIGLRRYTDGTYYRIMSYIGTQKSSSGVVSSYEMFRSTSDNLGSSNVFTKIWLSRE